MSRRDRAERIRQVMAEDGDAIGENTRTVNQLSGYAIDQFDDYEQLREQARQIKAEAIETLPERIEEVRAAVEANGGEVYVADDAADANDYIETVLEMRDADRIVKSKSMTTEELSLNERLAAGGFEVTETDLGEFVIQVADESPSHLIGPAMHRSADDIAALFNDRLDPAEPLAGDPHELTAFARDVVGEHIRAADAGITGANFVVSETGTLCLVTNEGNARKTAVTPPTHVAVAGVEKLVPSVSDLQPFVELIARTGTGQDITSYLSLVTPPVETPAVDFETDEYVPADDRTFHLVLLDNGRLEMRNDEQLRETLYCIRCGACSNSCANFQSVGGHAFGGETYTGGIGTGWEAGVYGLDSAAEMNDLCTGCSRCVEKCPVKIDIPWINTVVRDRLNRGAEPETFDPLVAGLTPDSEPAGLDIQKRLFGNVERLAAVGSLAPGLANTLADTQPVRRLLERVAGIDQRRDLPTLADETLVEWAADRPTDDDADRKAVVYPDMYTNYFEPERGQQAVRLLEALGVAVSVPSVPESGRAPLSQGMVSTADSAASDVYAALAEHIDAGRDIVVIEPSDIAMFHNEYGRLLPDRAAERLAGSSYELFEYLYELTDGGAELGALEAATDGSVVYHSHCQQRTLGLAAQTEALLEAVGYDVSTTDVECCGMAGSFGYKQEYYELSMDVGERLRESRPEGDHLVASGTSCCEQLSALEGERPPHPVTLLSTDS
ncbi:probable iron-sulfur protein (4Fe-4S) [Natronomonas pharaonis DSM 2160]|uniref:Probable iron-sulfur protein (4Fe-4S) n=1 Tax=Natronomonas pharaonis (strain ATCC 35678 / DSM 2160 / CIP 103997 / JCM 8858 / NBRC 14720 / NCIMB 2260 / Gabara) TaxID=348780 RepID=A0A1U7EVB8_NATPD|nr:LUD domain-containing protein [Natronomonas pharaonis]CAI48952.1 probable iron-sulfur protein (4Fe-4S) [Natronomonas pharaonis DSM 2160]